MFRAPKEIINFRVRITGVELDSTYYFPPLRAHELFMVMLHEVGHTISSTLYAKDILTPDQVKRMVVIFSDEEYWKFALLFLRLSPLQKIPTEFIPVISRLLDFYANGNFDVTKLDFRMLGEHEFQELIHAYSAETFEVKHDGVISLKSTKLGRNDEIGAIAAEDACLRMFMYEAPLITKIAFLFSLLSEVLKGRGYFDPDSSHGRAQRIVDRAYKSKHWVLPTSKDLSE